MHVRELPTQPPRALRGRLTCRTSVHTHSARCSCRRAPAHAASLNCTRAGRAQVCRAYAAVPLAERRAGAFARPFGHNKGSGTRGGYRAGGMAPQHLTCKFSREQPGWESSQPAVVPSAKGRRGGAPGWPAWASPGRAAAAGAVARAAGAGQAPRRRCVQGSHLALRMTVAAPAPCSKGAQRGRRGGAPNPIGRPQQRPAPPRRPPRLRSQHMWHRGTPLGRAAGGTQRSTPHLRSLSPPS